MSKAASPSLKLCPLTGKTPHTKCKCDSCRSERARVQREFRKKNPRHIRAMNLRKYGLTPEEFDIILNKQNGVCASCKSPQNGHNQFGKNSLCVDHDHISGNNRGLLCNLCNRALGLLKDNTNNIQALLNYRKQYDI